MISLINLSLFALWLLHNCNTALISYCSYSIMCYCNNSTLTLCILHLLTTLILNIVAHNLNINTKFVTLNVGETTLIRFLQINTNLVFFLFLYVGKGKGGKCLNQVGGPIQMLKPLRK